MISEARRLAEDEAITGAGVEKIIEILEERGFGDQLGRVEIEKIVEHAELARDFLTPSPARRAIRVFGALLIVGGIAAVVAGCTEPSSGASNPGIYGLVAIIVGNILFFHSSRVVRKG